MRRLREGQEDERRRKLEELKQHVRGGGEEWQESDFERPIVTGHESFGNVVTRVTTFLMELIPEM